MIKRLLLVLVLLISSPAFAAISYIADSSSTTGTATTRTPAEPTGTVEDDLVLAMCALGTQNDGVWTDPADFTEIDQQPASSTSREVYIGYKKRAATAGSGYTFSYSGTAGRIRCSLFTLRGQDLTTPIDVTYVTATHQNEATNTPNLAAQAITTVTNSSWVVLMYHASGSALTAAGAPSGYTKRAEYIANSHSNHVLATKAIATAGADTPGVWTHTDNSTQDVLQYTIAIRDASPASASSSLILLSQD